MIDREDRAEDYRKDILSGIIRSVSRDVQVSSRIRTYLTNDRGHCGTSLKVQAFERKYV